MMVAKSTISVFVILAYLVLANQTAAETLYLCMNDPVGDSSGTTDITNMSLEFDDQTGNYTLTLTADYFNPFFGNFRININLFNPDAGSTSRDASYFGDTLNDYNLATPTTKIVLEGTSSNLRSWSLTDRVATTTLSGLGNPDGSSFFRSAVGDFPLGSIFVREDVIGYDDALNGSIDPGSIGYISNSCVATAPESLVLVSPPTGTYALTQAFDLTVLAKQRGQAITYAEMLYDDVDRIQFFLGCMVVGATPDDWSTFRCPGITGGLLGVGKHTLKVTLEYADGAIDSDTVTWTIVQNSEP